MELPDRYKWNLNTLRPRLILVSIIVVGSKSRLSFVLHWKVGSSEYNIKQKESLYKTCYHLKIYFLVQRESIFGFVCDEGQFIIT
jgi:hypothetical protein